MFQLFADVSRLTVEQRETVASGGVNACLVKFRFSPEWDGLEKTAVFRAGQDSRAVLPEEDGRCAVPWELLAQPGRRLFAGILGRRGEGVVLPTVWADLGLILEGTDPGMPSLPPTPELWRQELDRKGDGLGYTEAGELGLYAGERLLSALPLSAPDHRKLSHLEDPDQHPMAAISGLVKELERIPEPVEALTNSELEEMLK